jgi:hypothetical protein
MEVGRLPHEWVDGCRAEADSPRTSEVRSAAARDSAGAMADDCFLRGSALTLKVPLPTMECESVLDAPALGRRSWPQVPKVSARKVRWSRGRRPSCVRSSSVSTSSCSPPARLWASTASRSQRKQALRRSPGLVISLVLFLIPYGMLVAELGSAFPVEGGPYEWVKISFGRLVGSVTAVLYWPTNPIWIGGTLAATAIATLNAFVVHKPLGTAGEIVVGLVFT